MISFYLEHKKQIKFILFFFIASTSVGFGQIKDSMDLTFTGANINPYAQEFDTSGKVVFSAYIDSYFSSYSDQNKGESFVKFPTVSPRNQQFGLNIVQGSAKYQSSRFRGTITIFGGDCASAAWSRELNMVQEANLGFHLAGRWWLDAGLFRTHIGLESIQPRENITLSLATTTYFEPYFMSGAKLTCELNPKWTFQINTFNSFNQFIETNRNKAVGFSFNYVPNGSVGMTFSSIMSDEIQRAEEKPIHYRLYNNFCLTIRRPKYVIGFELNGGMQQRSTMDDTTRTALMASSLLAFKYRFTHKWAAYCRAEWFHDPNEILTGPIYNEYHNIVGAEMIGATSGIEFKPIANSFVRGEFRFLNERAEKIFLTGSTPTAYRWEILLGMGLWF